MIIKEAYDIELPLYIKAVFNSRLCRKACCARAPAVAGQRAAALAADGRRSAPTLVGPVTPTRVGPSLPRRYPCTDLSKIARRGRPGPASKESLLPGGAAWNSLLILVMTTPSRSLDLLTSGCRATRHAARASARGLLPKSCIIRWTAPWGTRNAFVCVNPNKGGTPRR